jgi:2-methylcitrate dehydratase PrpD
MLLNFGPPFRVVKPGFAIKAFPCKYQTHYTIVCGLALHDQVKAPGEISEIKITSPEFPAADRPNPLTGLEGMFSLQFTLLAALLDGKVDLETFTDERVRQADMQALLPKVNLEMNPDISSEFDGRLIQVAISMKNGSVLRSECAKPPGSWGAPPIPDAQYDRKIQDCLGPSFSPAQMESFKNSAGRMSALSAAEVQALMRLCRKSENSADLSGGLGGFYESE